MRPQPTAHSVCPCGSKMASWRRSRCFGSRRCFFRVMVPVLLLYGFIIVYLLHTDVFVSRITMTMCNTKDECSLQDVPSRLSPNLLLILIFSNAVGEEAKEKRDAIRATWAKDLQDSSSIYCRYRFVLGVEDLEEKDRDKIKEEAELHNDIIYFYDVKNSYFSLTDRTMRAFQYIAEQQYKFSYVLKCDDDTFPDVEKIAMELQNRENPGRLYWGEFVMGFVQTKGIWSETRWSSCQTYYPYAYGGGYILSGDVVELMAENAPYLKKYKSEDVSIASWISAYNIERKHDVRFTTGGKPRGCKKVYLMVHKTVTKKIEGHYTSLIHDGSICGPSNSWHGYSGYLYNWNAFPPSTKCCKRFPEIP